MKERIYELRDVLNKANYDYYVLENPTLSDYEFDHLMRELIDLEAKYPECYDANSPSLRVGGEVVETFNKITHKRMMLSLANAFNNEELEMFDKRVKEALQTNNEIEYMYEAAGELEHWVYYRKKGTEKWKNKGLEDHNFINGKCSKCKYIKQVDLGPANV